MRHSVIGDEMIQFSLEFRFLYRFLIFETHKKFFLVLSSISLNAKDDRCLNQHRSLREM